MSGRSALTVFVNRAGRFSSFGVETGAEVMGFQIDASGAVPPLVADGWTGADLVVDVKPDPDRDQLAGQPGAGIQIQQITILTRP